MIKPDQERGYPMPQVALTAKKQTIHLGLQMLCSDPQLGNLAGGGSHEDCTMPASVSRQR